MARRLLRERLELAYRPLPFSILAGLIGMAGLWWAARWTGHGTAAGAWLLLLLALSLVRYGLVWRYRRAERPVSNPAWWHVWLTASTLLTGLVWLGFATALYAEPLPAIVAHLALLTLFAIISVTPYTLGVLPAPCYAQLLPTAIALLQATRSVFGDLGTPVSAFLVAWTALTLLLARQARMAHARMVTLQTHNENLLEETQTAVARSRESEDRLRALLTLSADDFWETDARLRFVRAVDERVVGGRGNHLREGMAPWEIPGAEPVDGTWEAHRALLERREAFRDFALRRTAPDGRQFIFLISGAPVFDPSGQFAGYRGTSKDITALKRIEQELAQAKAETEARNDQLRASEEKFRTLVELSSDWYWERDAEHRLIAFAGKFGEGAPERPRLALGTLPWEVPYMEPVDASWDLQKSIVAAREPFRDLLLRMNAPGMRERYFLVSGGPIFSADGRFLGYRGTSKDVTEQKHVERELERAKQAAEAASRAKSQFLANMSHEIRTPMNGISGALQLLARTPLTAEQQKLARIAHGSADALLQIIDDILDFSKIEAGKLTIEEAPFDLGACVRDAVELLRARATEKGLALHWFVAPDVPASIRGDAGRLRQILLNLVGNAVKFTAVGEVAVRVERDRGNGGSDMLRFSVRDTGIGMEPDVQARLFQPFSQGDSSMHRRFGGTGLGLAICKHLVQAMGGEISVESAPERGTTFWFWLPVMPVAQEEPPELASAAKTLNSAASPRVLVVEDNIVNQEVARAMLRHLGATTQIAADGGAAVRRIEGGERYDLIFMDCQMPGMDGYEATRRIREYELASGRPRAPIVALTANAMQGDRERCMAAGMDDYLSKPYSVSHLGAMLATWTGTERRQPPSGVAVAEDRRVAGVEGAVDDRQKEDL